MRRRMPRRTRTTSTSHPSGRVSGPPTRSGSRASVADAPPSPPLLLASTSPQRRAILEQLHIPFDVVAPNYDEATPEDADPVQVVLEHARGKARSVAGIADDRPVVGVVTPGWEDVEHEATRVTFRELAPRELGTYVATGEWEGRAGAYAIQGRGASLVRCIEGDYLNVVGLPAALLVRLLAERFSGVYGFG